MFWQLQEVEKNDLPDCTVARSFSPSGQIPIIFRASSISPGPFKDGTTFPPKRVQNHFAITARWLFLRWALGIHKWSLSQSLSCPTLCNPMDSNQPGSSVHGISQARILEWVAISVSRGSSWPRAGSRVSCISSRFFTIWATWEAFLWCRVVQVWTLESEKPGAP